MKASVEIPLYETDLILLVVEDPRKAREEWTKTFGENTDGNFAAACVAQDNKVGLFFPAKGLTHELLAHEIFHAVHHVMKEVGAEFEHESHAYLCGWMTAWVYRKLTQNKISVGA